MFIGAIPQLRARRAPRARGARAARTFVLWAIGIGLAIVMTWPLASGLDHLGRTQNSGDARFAVWNVAWVAHALTNSPTELFNANIFHPHRRVLAFSEANLGAGALAVPIWWLTRDAITSHNAVVLVAFASSFALAWLLVRRLTGDPVAASVGAIMYAFCPYLFSHTAHIQLLMAGGIPLVMLMFHRLADFPSACHGLHLGLALAATALSSAYYGVFSGLTVGYATLFYAFSRGSWRTRMYWAAIAAAALTAAAVVLPFFLPYLEIQAETGFSRSLDDARVYSASWKSYLASGARPHRWMLPYLASWNNEVLFPGFAAVVFGTIGFVVAYRSERAAPGERPASRCRRETALFYGSVALFAFWASLGPAAGLYTLLYETVPVFSFLRAPGRIGIMVALALAVLAGHAVRALRTRFQGRAPIVAALCLAATVADLRQFPFDWRKDQEPPASYQVLARLPRGPVVEFPFYYRRLDLHIHTRYMLNSTLHWQPLVNGYSDYVPADFRTFAARLATFPSPDAFRAMKEREVRYITVHRDRYGRSKAAEVERKLTKFHQYLLLHAEDEQMMLFEIVAWPQ